MENTFYTVEQISDMLNLHPKTVQRYIREGKLKAVKFGKGWRVTGHDLSVFTEQRPETSERVPTDIVVSAVADISVDSKNAAIRIMNTLTAVLNTKPPEYGASSLQTQFIVPENKVRVTLWGTPRFMAAMMDCIVVLNESTIEE
jgi:excisionase family DNA binding protein